MELRQAHDGSDVIFGDRSGMSYYDVKAEYRHAAVTCLVRTAVRHAQGQLSLAKYLTGILSHLKHEGGAHHQFDDSPKHRRAEDLWPFLVFDFLAGAVKGLMWSDGFKPLGDKEWRTLRYLAAIAWETGDWDEFQQRSRQKNAHLSDLSSEAADLLLIISYSRRHLNLFTNLLGAVPAPAQSSFDRFGGPVVESRILPLSSMHQHSRHVPENVELEARFWTLLLNSEWVHDPLESTLKRQIENMSVTLFSDRSSDGWAPWGIKLSSPVLSEIHQALARRHIHPSLSTVGHLLARFSTVDQAKRYLSGVSAEGVMQYVGSSYGNPSGALTVAIAESTNLKGSSRAEVMRLALEKFTGLNVDAAIHRPWIEDMRGFGRPDEYNDEFNALHAAAWQGDRELAEVLVEFGAKISVVDRISRQDARGVARKQGHDALADWLDREARGRR